MADAATNALLEQAKCLKCYPESVQTEMQTYIMAAVAGVGMDPIQLAKDAKCFTCLSLDTLLRIKAYLLSLQARLDPTPSTLILVSKCYECIPEGMLQSIDTYQILNDSKSPNSDPAAVSKISRCFGCLSSQTLLEVQVYLLSILARSSQDPNTLAQISNVISTIPSTVIRRVITRTIVEAEEGGGGISGCIDVPADLIPVLTAHYTTGTLTSIDILFPKVCCNPYGYIVYESANADMSGATEFGNDSIDASHAGEANYTVNGIDVTGITGPYVAVKQVCQDLSESDYSNVVDAIQTCGTPTSVINVVGAGTAAANGSYVNTGYSTWTDPDTNYYITFIGGVGGLEAALYDNGATELYRLADTQCFPCGEWTATGGAAPAPTPIWGTQAEAEALAWAARVVDNGGVRPSDATINAAITFVDALITANIRTKMRLVNFIAPDNLTAAITPLNPGQGFTFWTNNNFVDADLTVNGLKGDNATKYLDTGFLPNYMLSLTSAGLTAYAYSDVTATDYLMGREITSASTSAFELYATGGNMEFRCWQSTSGTGSVVYVGGQKPGYFSGSRTAANLSTLYFADGGTPFAAVASINNTAGAIPTGSMLAFASVLVGVMGWTNARISFFAIHDGLDATESSALYNAVRALRVTLGGGYL